MALRILYHPGFVPSRNPEGLNDLIHLQEFVPSRNPEGLNDLVHLKVDDRSTTRTKTSLIDGR